MPKVRSGGICKTLVPHGQGRNVTCRMLVVRVIPDAKNGCGRCSFSQLVAIRIGFVSQTLIVDATGYPLKTCSRYISISVEREITDPGD